MGSQRTIHDGPLGGVDTMLRREKDLMCPPAADGEFHAMILFRARIGLPGPGAGLRTYRCFPVTVFLQGDEDIDARR